MPMPNIMAMEQVWRPPRLVSVANGCYCAWRTVNPGKSCDQLYIEVESCFYMSFLNTRLHQAPAGAPVWSIFARANLAHDLGSSPQDHADLGRHPRITPILEAVISQRTCAQG